MLAADLSSIPSWFYEEIATVGIHTLSWCDCRTQRSATRRRDASAQHWMLIVVDSGAITVRYRSMDYEIGDGHAIILPAGSGHRETTHVPTRIGRFPIVMIGDSVLARHPLASLELPQVLPLADPHSAAELLNKIAEMSPRSRYRKPHERLSANMIVTSLVFNALAGGFANGVLPSERNATPEWALACRRLLRDRFADPRLSVADLASLAGRSERQVARVFAMCFGYSPKEWLNRYRIDVACRILSNTPSLTIASVIERCGFRNRSLFYRLFKRWTGASPSELRQCTTRIGDG